MKGIRQVRIGPAVYKIVDMTPEEHEECEAQGLVNVHTCTIKINPRLSHFRQVEILWHEIKHAIHELADLGDDSKEEDYCRRAAPLELDVLCSNPQLVKLISKVRLDLSKSKD
jgi:hypothetical protein